MPDHPPIPECEHMVTAWVVKTGRNAHIPIMTCRGSRCHRWAPQFKSGGTKGPMPPGALQPGKDTGLGWCRDNLNRPAFPDSAKQ